MKKLETGDIVRLKSGGPKMTVRENPEGFYLIMCDWFTEGKIRSAQFRKEQLDQVLNHD